MMDTLLYFCKGCRNYGNNNSKAIFAGYKYNPTAMAQELKPHKTDDLLRVARHYTLTSNFLHLLDFCSRMRHLSPYNAMLAWFQNPNASLLLSAPDWHTHGCTLKESARATVIFMPFCPGEYLFDQTAVDILNPPLIGGDQDYFERIRSQILPPLYNDVPSLWNNLRNNIALDGISVDLHYDNQPDYNVIQPVGQESKHTVKIVIQGASKPVQSPAFYHLLLDNPGWGDESDKSNSTDTRIGTLILQLSRIYCHHHPAPDGREWAQRHLSQTATQFESMSVLKLVTDHFGISQPTDYFSTYIASNTYIPKSVSMDTIMSAAGRIIQMATNRRLPFQNGLLYRLSKDFQSKVTRIKNKKRRAAAAAATLQEYPIIPGFE